jgi:hypothetical protein
MLTSDIGIRKAEEQRLFLFFGCSMLSPVDFFAMTDRINRGGKGALSFASNNKQK